jgi:uncharacterized protein (DUF302 family)
MTYTRTSIRSMEDIELRLRDAAQRHKFGVLHVLDLKQTLQSKGIELGRECRIFDVCNPQAASAALKHDMAASVVLPCRIAVYAEGNGCTIATVRPTDLMQATGLKGVEPLAQEIEREIAAIIDEAA